MGQRLDFARGGYYLWGFSAIAIKVILTLGLRWGYNFQESF